MIQFKCHDCGEGMQAPSEMTGQSIRCPNCGANEVIPSDRVIRTRQTQQYSTIPFLLSYKNILLVSCSVLLAIFFIVFIFSEQKERENHQNVFPTDEERAQWKKERQIAEGQMVDQWERNRERERIATERERLAIERESKIKQQQAERKSKARDYIHYLVIQHFDIPDSVRFSWFSEDFRFYDDGQIYVKDTLTTKSLIGLKQEYSFAIMIQEHKYGDYAVVWGPNFRRIN